MGKPQSRSDAETQISSAEILFQRDSDMKNTLKILTLVLFISLFRPAAGEDLSGREIAEKAFSRYDGDDGYFKIEMTLIDRKGAERKRLLEIYNKDYGELTKSYLKFLKPPDIEKTSFLTWENETGDDTQYLYLPALGRMRRIVSSQNNLRFVNTDFTYEDMQRRKPDKDEHARLPDEKYLEYSCGVVESVPKKETSEYSRRISWIDKESFIILKTDFYNKKGKKSKEFRVKELRKYQDIQTVTHTVMRDLKEKHKTVMKLLEVKYNQNIKDETFSLRFLENN